MKKDLRTPLAKARDDFFESDEGKRLLRNDICLVGNHPYLKNRLETAFIAGASAARHFPLESLNQITELLEELLRLQRRKSRERRSK